MSWKIMRIKKVSTYSSDMYVPNAAIYEFLVSLHILRLRLAKSFGVDLFGGMSYFDGEKTKTNLKQTLLDIFSSDFNEIFNKRIRESSSSYNYLIEFKRPKFWFQLALDFQDYCFEARREINLEFALNLLNQFSEEMFSWWTWNRLGIKLPESGDFFREIGHQKTHHLDDKNIQKNVYLINEFIMKIKDSYKIPQKIFYRIDASIEGEGYYWFYNLEYIEQMSRSLMMK
jgi:hypothetical protein